MLPASAALPEMRPPRLRKFRSSTMMKEWDFVASFFRVRRGFLRARAAVAKLCHLAQDHAFAEMTAVRESTASTLRSGYFFCRISAAILPAPQVPLMPPAMPR